MKSLLKTLSICGAFILSAIAVQAQMPLVPQPSSTQTIVQDFGLGKVTLNYSRPNKKGRTVFGGLVPYDEVWRTGANSATTITFTDDVTIADNNVVAGKYALFTIPGKTEWTVILNKTAAQWGAYAYKKENDVLRFTVKATQLPFTSETFTMQFEDVKPGDMVLHLLWDKTLVTIPMHVDYDAKAMANIDAAMNGDKKPYVQAAQYYYSNDKDLTKALAWMNEGEKADAKAPWIKYWKAKIQLKMGDKKAATITATEGIALAKAINNSEYIKLNQEVLDSAK